MMSKTGFFNRDRDQDFNKSVFESRLGLRLSGLQS